MLFVALSIPTGRPTIEIRDFHMVESKGSNRSVELWANTARVFKTEDLMVFDQLSADIWPEASNREDAEARPYRVTGEIGVLKSETEDFGVEGDSTVQSPDSYKFLTKNIVFNSSEKILQTDQRVDGGPTNTGAEGFSISGNGLTIDTRQGWYRIHSSVKAVQKLDKSSGGDLNIRSQTALIWPNQNNAVFEKSVFVDSKDLSLKGGKLDVEFSKTQEQSPMRIKNLNLGPTQGSKLATEQKIQAQVSDLKIQSEGLKVNFDENGNWIDTEALGGAQAHTEDGVKMFAEKLKSRKRENITVVELFKKVRILTDTKDATCEQAEFVPSTGEATLNRIASVKTNDQLIEGEIIKFSTKNSEIRVEKASGVLDKKQLVTE